METLKFAFFALCVTCNMWESHMRDRYRKSHVRITHSQPVEQLLRAAHIPVYFAGT